MQYSCAHEKEPLVDLYIDLKSYSQILQPIPEEQLAILRPYPAVIDLLKYILVREPLARPSPSNILAR